MHLRKVDPSSITDIKFLYRMLEERESLINISHRNMPSFDEHMVFVNSNPYKNWYIIEDNLEMIGHCNIGRNVMLDNEMGYWIRPKFQRKGYATNAVKEMMKENPRKRYLANIAPNNVKSQEFIKSLGFNICQYTYELDTS